MLNVGASLGQYLLRAFRKDHGSALSSARVVGKAMLHAWAQGGYVDRTIAAEGRVVAGIMQFARCNRRLSRCEA